MRTQNMMKRKMRFKITITREQLAMSLCCANKGNLALTPKHRLDCVRIDGSDTTATQGSVLLQIHQHRGQEARPNNEHPLLILKSDMVRIQDQFFTSDDQLLIELHITKDASCSAYTLSDGDKSIDLQYIPDLYPPKAVLESLKPNEERKPESEVTIDIILLFQLVSTLVRCGSGDDHPSVTLKLFGAGAPVTFKTNGISHKRSTLSGIIMPVHSPSKSRDYN